MNARHLALAALAAVLLPGCHAGDSSAPSGGDAPPPPPLEIVGADISSLSAVESAGGRFSDNGVPGDPLAILKRYGVNYVRVRLFHTPDTSRELVNDLSYDLALAKRAKAAGFGLLLCIHYSDTWADPGHQAKPGAWASLPFDNLRDSVFAYTRDVVAAFRDAGAMPDMVQIGNEVNTGMLFPDGHALDDDAEWTRFAALVKAGRDGARAAAGAGSPMRIMHHVADPATVEWHMDHLLAHLGPPDVIGVSYYPFWHGDLATFRTNMSRIASKYGLPIVIAETAYPWTNAYVDGYADAYHGAPPAGMPPYSPTGQATFLTQLASAIRAVPDGRGIGLFYWEPLWLPSNTFGSPVDNLTLLDPSGAVLPALPALRAAAGRGDSSGT